MSCSERLSEAGIKGETTGDRFLQQDKGNHPRRPKRFTLNPSPYNNRAAVTQQQKTSLLNQDVKRHQHKDSAFNHKPLEALTAPVWRKPLNHESTRCSDVQLLVPVLQKEAGPLSNVPT